MVWNGKRKCLFANAISVDAVLAFIFNNITLQLNLNAILRPDHPDPRHLI